MTESGVPLASEAKSIVKYHYVFLSLWQQSHLARQGKYVYESPVLRKASRWYGKVIAQIAITLKKNLRWFLRPQGGASASSGGIFAIRC
jgi:hypothetical protein